MISRSFSFYDAVFEERYSGIILNLAKFNIAETSFQEDRRCLCIARHIQQLAGEGSSSIRGILSAEESPIMPSSGVQLLLNYSNDIPLSPQNFCPPAAKLTAPPHCLVLQLSLNRAVFFTQSLPRIEELCPLDGQTDRLRSYRLGWRRPRTHWIHLMFVKAVFKDLLTKSTCMLLALFPLRF